MKHEQFHNRADDPRQITMGLGGKWHRSYGAAACPICQPERRKDQIALTITTGQDGRLLANCKKGFCSFRDILDALRSLGLVEGSGQYRPLSPAELSALKQAANDEADRKAAQARSIWKEASSIGGTIAEAYLRGRGLTCDLPKTLRFHPECWHGLSGRKMPAMIAAVQGARRPAIHRTFLRPDGNGKAAVEPNKMMLGATAGGAVRLSGGAGRLVVCEGIETGLALYSGLLPAPATIWAALSASGMKALLLPEEPGRLTIATDGDKAGREAGQVLAERAHSAGWRVGTLDPGDGLDFNDLLCGEVTI